VRVLVTQNEEVSTRRRGGVAHIQRRLVTNPHMTYQQKLMEMAKEEIGITEEEHNVNGEAQEIKKTKRRNKKRRKKSRRVTKQEAIEEKLERMGEEEGVGTVTEKYTTVGEPSLTPPNETEQGAGSAVEEHGGNKEVEPKGMPMTEMGESKTKEEEKEENIFDVPKSVKKVLEQLGGSFVGIVTPDGQMYQKVGDKYVKSIPPDVEIGDNKLVIKANMDVVKQYAMLAKGGKVAISINIGNNRAVVNVWVDKNGHIYIPPTLKKYIHVEPDGTITVDVLKVLPKYFVNRIAKKGGSKLKINVSYWGKFAGFNAPIAGRTVEADIEPEE